jgi:hypothetical protein
MKPCGSALLDAVPASIRKMQAAAMDFGIDAISTKTRWTLFTTAAPIFNDTAKMKRAAEAALLHTIKKL